jgi:hypothetical protein
MPPGFALYLAASCTLGLALSCPCSAWEQPQPQSGVSANRVGIVTDGLSGTQLRTWKSVIDIVMAKDKRGSYLHPTLYELYRQAETSGHLIRIELSEVESLSQAGRFSIEVLDADGKRHVAKIRLNLATIRRTHVGKDARTTNGLIPFEGLRTRECYAEALGHELAHAVSILLDREYLQLYQDLNNEVAQYERHLNGLEDSHDDRDRHRSEIDRMLATLEKPAQDAEARIWRELRRLGK